MIQNLRLHGGAGSILWGYREAILLRSWRITQDKKSKAWTLNGVTARVDAFQARQRPLLFTAPHQTSRNGFWAWPVEKLEVGPGKIVAVLGQPVR